MRQLIFVCAVLSALALSLVGCGGGAASAVGTWKPDLNSVKMTSKDAAKQAQIDQAMPQVKQMIGQQAYTFKADGTYSGTAVGGVADTGKYTVSGNTVNITPDKALPAGSTLPTITLSGDGKTMSFHADTPQGTVDVNFTKSS